MAEREQRLAQALDEQTRLTEAWRAQSESLVQQVNACATRVAEVMQEREARERAERHRTRDRGDDYGL